MLYRCQKTVFPFSISSFRINIRDAKDKGCAKEKGLSFIIFFQIRRTEIKLKRSLTPKKKITLD